MPHSVAFEPNAKPISMLNEISSENSILNFEVKNQNKFVEFLVQQMWEVMISINTSRVGRR